MIRIGVCVVATTALMASQPALRMEGAEMSDAAKSFNELTAAHGADYVRARGAFLSRADSAEFLTAQKSNASDTEQWVAEILLARRAWGEEFDHLEAVFHATMPRLVLGLPHSYRDSPVQPSKRFFARWKTSRRSRVCGSKYSTRSRV